MNHAQLIINNLFSLALTALKYIMISGRQDRCLADKNCPSYSQCYKKLCTCKDEFHGNGEKCKKSKQSFYALAYTRHVA